jgi:hypothetical protein
LEGGDEDAADQTEDENVTLHDGVTKKYNEGGEEVVWGVEPAVPCPLDGFDLIWETRIKVKQKERSSC